jgi:enoyl-CoA hydratase
MEFSNYPALLLKREGHVLYATMNRPDTLNAIDPQLDDDLIRLFVDVADDTQTRVVVLTGAGKAFSAGGDLDVIQTMIDTPSMMYDMIPRAKRLINNLLDCPKPVIAKVNGHAVGLGATMALFCDLVFASTSAKIADPHVSLGLVAGDGGALIWSHLIGHVRAKAYLFTGDPITAEEAASIGLINKAVPLEELDAVVDAFAQRLANQPARALQWTKLVANIHLKSQAASMLDAGIAYEALSNHSQDHQIATKAALNKIKPTYTGD